LVLSTSGRFTRDSGHATLESQPWSAAMTIVEFYMAGKDTIENFDVHISGGSGYGVRVGAGELADKKVVRVLVQLRSKAFLEDALKSMMRVVLLYPICTVTFHGFHD
jgi:hypothetical protein